MKRGLEVYSDDIVGALRISIAFLSLLPFIIFRLKRVKRELWKYLILTGMLGNLIPAFLFAKAQTEIPSYLAGMLNSLTPIFALVIGVTIFHVKVNKIKVLGVFIGLFGTICLILSGGIGSTQINYWYILFIVFSTLCYATSANTIKTQLGSLNSIALTALSLLTVGPFSILYLFFTDFLEVTVSHERSASALIYISTLAIFGTGVSLVLFNFLIKRTSTLFATSVTYLIPIVAILWGVIDGEKIELLQMLSGCIVFLGIYCINKKDQVT